MSVARSGGTCPSSSCEPGNLLLGIVGPDGRLAQLQPPIRVDEDFVQRASGPGLRAPEARFRFAGPCVRSGCNHWSEGRCGLGDAAAKAATRLPEPERLPRCSIRKSCQWFAQAGAAACRVCPTIVRTREVSR